MPVAVRLLLVLSLLGAVACGRDGGDAAGDRTQVVASFYPLEFVVEEVGGDLVDLDNLTPPGAEPHDLELTPGQIRTLADADLLVYIGDGFQPSVEEAIRELDVSVVDVLERQRDLLEPPEHEDEHADETSEHEGAHEEESSVDPHLWLDPEKVGEIARVVAHELAQLDPDNAQTFRANAAALQSRLGSLDAQFREGLADCRRATIVTSHAAFGYLAHAYGLEEVPIAGIDPEAEPSPQRLAEVARFVRDNNVTTVFFEVLVSPRTAETLADEAGIETARLDPLEGPPQEGDYFTAMRGNLDALRRGLGCT